MVARWPMDRFHSRSIRLGSAFGRTAGQPRCPDVVDRAGEGSWSVIAVGEWTIGIESATMPTWRRDSAVCWLGVMQADRLCETRSPFSSSKAEVISLDGKRRKLSTSPRCDLGSLDRRHHLAYVDADRVMRAVFGATRSWIHRSRWGRCGVVMSTSDERDHC